MKRRPNGSGSICLRKDGRWYVVLQRTINGKCDRIYMYSKTREEAEQKLEALIGQLPPTVRAGKGTLAAFLYSWLDDIVVLRNKPRTAEGYRQLINEHIVPRIGMIPLKKLGPEHVQKMINDITKTHSAHTIRNVRAVLRTALSHALRWDLVPRNVAKLVDIPRIEKYRIHPLTPQHARQLLNAVKGKRLEALYHVALFLGLRRGEIMGLRWSNIDFENHTLEVSGALQRIDSKLVRVSTKTDRVRVLPLPSMLAATLQEHRKRQDADGHTGEYVFVTTVGTPIDPSNITHGFKQILKRAGIPDMRFHDLRHSCATLLVSQGVPLSVIKDILGHTTITTTADYYAHTLQDTSRQAIDKLEGLLG